VLRHVEGTGIVSKKLSAYDRPGWIALNPGTNQLDSFLTSVHEFSIHFLIIAIISRPHPPTPNVSRRTPLLASLSNGPLECHYQRLKIIADPSDFELRPVKDELAAIKGFGATGCGGAFYAPDAKYGLEGIAGKPVLSRLRLKMLKEQVDFASTDFLGERDENVGTAQVAVVLENFVLKNDVIPERVPRQV
jgi:hypothetical protein